MGNQIIQFANAGNNTGSPIKIINSNATDIINLINTNSLEYPCIYEFNYVMVWKLGGTIGDIYAQNGTDRLQILSTSQNTYSPKANSLFYPELDIDFTFDIPFGWIPTVWFGYITRIIDNSQNKENNIGGDYRFLQWRRWDDGFGNYTISVDNGNSFIDINAFPNVVTRTNIDQLITTLNNTIIQSAQCYGLECNSCSFTNSRITTAFQTICKYVFSNDSKITLQTSELINVNINNNNDTNFFSGIYETVDLTNITQCNMNLKNMSNFFATNITLITISGGDFDKIQITNITEFSIGLSKLNDVTFTNITTIDIYQGQINNYVGQSDFILSPSPSFPNPYESRFSLGGNVCIFYEKINLAALAIGNNFRNAIPKGFKVANVRYVVLNNTSGVGTLQIGTSTFPTCILPATSIATLNQQNINNTTTGYQPANENINFLLAGGVFSSGTMFLTITFLLDS